MSTILLCNTLAFYVKTNPISQIGEIFGRKTEDEVVCIMPSKCGIFITVSI